MGKVTRKEWYRRVNATWPTGPLPALTATEAERAARRLYRFGMKKTWTGPVKITSGRRYTWIRWGTMVVNPEQGWHGLVHLLSHYCHDRLHPEVHGHNSVHARAEIRMIKEVLRRGWLEGKLRNRPLLPPPVPTPLEVRNEKLERTLAAIKRWETKQKRAETALRKLHRRRKYYERAALPPPQEQELAA
jgi:hypothetical protein